MSDWVPLPDLVEKSEFGPLPKISDGDVRPLDAYSQASGMTGANRVAIIVGGLGLSQTGTQSAIKKPAVFHHPWIFAAGQFPATLDANRTP